MSNFHKQSLYATFHSKNISLSTTVCSFKMCCAQACKVNLLLRWADDLSWAESCHLSLCRGCVRIQILGTTLLGQYTWQVNNQQHWTKKHRASCIFWGSFLRKLRSFNIQQLQHHAVDDLHLYYYVFVLVWIVLIPFVSLCIKTKHY